MAISLLNNLRIVLDILKLTINYFFRKRSRTM